MKVYKSSFHRSRKDRRMDPQDPSTNKIMLEQENIHSLEEILRYKHPLLDATAYCISITNLI